MNIIVVGAGEVGSNIAGSLAGNHDVTVIDIDGDRIDTITYSLDVLALQGDGTELPTLREANVETADLVIASTDEDETNLATCGTVKAVSDAFTIARVKRKTYLETWQERHGAFGVDFMVCTDLLAAQATTRVIGLPTAIDVDVFADGAIQMAEFEVGPDSPVAEQTVAEADRYEGLSFAAVIVDGEIEIARGPTLITQGSRIVVIGRPESVRQFAGAVGAGPVEDARDVVIFGGSTVGILIAELLEDRDLRPRLVEADEEQARRIAERLPKTTVMEHDATDQEFMQEEDVGEADIVVAALSSDETNLLVSLLAKRLGAQRTIAIVDDGNYVDIFEAVGVDVAVNPREVTAEEVTRFTREQKAENVAIVESDRAEVMELEVDADSVLAGRALAEAAAELPAGIVVGALVRNGDVIVPRGQTRIEIGDNIVVFVAADHLEEAVAAL
ncbi:MAG: Trk system potassium transporter TrkA [Halobacteriaceae archaeon]